eukprot:TRINITY_DN12378_c0_g1_i1.p1 TRINITY_DN12378_c0_g1~~TRINITY_DN12378_c0_g1_i1.p1  ORF type:complete len:925 (-),score=103.23 TRINITY_DN12378_c0_g1_i1:64-2838(-)
MKLDFVSTVAVTLLLPQTLHVEARLRQRQIPGSGNIEKGAIDIIHKGSGKAVDDLLHTVRRLKRVSEARSASPVEDLRENFLPQLTFKPELFRGSIIFFVISSMWFAVYSQRVYQNDRSPTLQRWASSLKSAGIDFTESHDVVHSDCVTDEKTDYPDLVFVFHSPAKSLPDDDTALPLHTIDRLFTDAEDAKARGACKHLRQLRQDAGVDNRRTSFNFRNVLSFNNAHDEVPQPTKREARVACIKDCSRLIKALGFSAMTFSSIDEDELFMCVYLDDEEAVKRCLEQGNYHLQLRHKVIEKFGILQDPLDPASSPPYMPFDPMLVKRLHEAGLLKEGLPSELYKTFFGDRGADAVVSSTDRIRIMFEQLNAYIHLDAAVTHGMMVSYYPIHNLHRVRELTVTWAGLRTMLDVSFVQPVELVNRYFGSEVGLMFAWSGTLCKALLALSVTSLAWIVASALFGRGRNELFGLSFVLGLWSQFAEILWSREEAYYLKAWSLEGRVTRNVVRQEFSGNEVQSPIDKNRMEKFYPTHLHILRIIISMTVTLCLCGMVLIGIHMWLFLFKGKLSISSSILLSLNIKVFELIFGLLIVVLTNFENHKYTKSYYTSYLHKYFIFQFVNNYSPFFYLIVESDNRPEMCEHRDCLADMRRQLIVSQFVLLVCSVFQAGVSATFLHFKLEFEVWRMKMTGKTPIARSRVEEESKYDHFGMRQGIDTVLPLVISLGHVLLFGAVAPIIAVFCLIVFVVHMKASAYMLSCTYKRAMPIYVQGMSTWGLIVSRMMTLGICFSGLLFVSHGETFVGTPRLTRVTGFVVYCGTIFFLRLVLSMMFPQVDESTDVLELRRHHVLMSIRRYGSTLNDKAGAGSKKNEDISEPAITNEDWGSIPPLHELEAQPCPLVRHKTSQLMMLSPRQISEGPRRISNEQ